MPYGQAGAGVCFATAVFLCGVTGFPSAPDSPPPANGAIVLDDGGSTTVAPGQKIRISGDGFASRAAVTVSVYSSPKRLAHVVADKSGHISTPVVIPGRLRGDHVLSAIGNGPGRSAHVLDAGILVKKRPVTAVLPATGVGFSLALWAVAGCALVASGLIMVRTVVMRRPLTPR